jgi:hypothetical protein
MPSTSRYVIFRLDVCVHSCLAHHDSLIGAGICVAGNICVSAGLNVQKLAHQRLCPASSALSSGLSTPVPHESSPLLPAHPEHIRVVVDADGDDDVDPDANTRPVYPNGKSRPGEDEYRPGASAYLRSKLWWFGLALMAAGETGNFLCELSSHTNRSVLTTTTLTFFWGSQSLRFCSRVPSSTARYRRSDRQLHHCPDYTRRTLSVSRHCERADVFPAAMCRI